MFEDEPRKAPTAHEVGMVLDGLSVEELEERIGLLETEIARLREAIGQRRSTRSAADDIFRF
jgi:uncharacterized small protein (DUF1192 family)